MVYATTAWPGFCFFLKKDYFLRLLPALFFCGPCACLVTCLEGALDSLELALWMGVAAGDKTRPSAGAEVLSTAELALAHCF